MPTLFLTGATGALAEAIRAAYLEAGWSVAGFSRSADAFRHPSYRSFAADATDQGSLSATMSAAKEAVGAPQALVATVGGIKPWRSVAETSTGDFRALLELNLTSFFLAAKLVMPMMAAAAAGGTIISIGAEAALEPTALKGGYAASKAGVLALTRVLAAEGSALSITANSIVPGTIRTRPNEEWGTPEMIAGWTTPEAIAETCLYLSSDAGRRVTGSVIRMPDKAQA